MKLEPAPANDYLEFMRVYHERSRERVPQLRAVAAKWAYEDLIPGLSDFDTRFVLADGMTIDDWHAFSLAVGEVHREMAEQFPRWHRNLEHLPGINLMVSEMLDQRVQYPEYRQWTFYDGDPAVIAQLECYVQHRRWSRDDELYHLHKVATFCGPYQRGIDPPVNLGPWESKYPLHSRLMHWFAPPVQAMVSLKHRQTIRGKCEALRLAREVLPNPRTIDRVQAIVEHHYEMPGLYREPMLSELECELEYYLQEAWLSLKGTLTLIEPVPHEKRRSLQQKIASIACDPVQQFFANARFSRQMKGRLSFYAADVPGFETRFLIRNELDRLVSNFYEKPLRAFARARLGGEQPAACVLERLAGDLLERDEATGMREFVTLVEPAIEEGQEKQRAAEAAATYEPVLCVLEKLGDHLRKHARPDVRGDGRIDAPLAQQQSG